LVEKMKWLAVGSNQVIENEKTQVRNNDVELALFRRKANAGQAAALLRQKFERWKKGGLRQISGKIRPSSE
jgi:hypothetical protein